MERKKKCLDTDLDIIYNWEVDPQEFKELAFRLWQVLVCE